MKILQILLILFTGLNISAQEEYIAKVVDLESQYPLEGVEIIDQTTKQRTFTDNNGSFIIKSNGTLLIKAAGFYDLVLQPNQRTGTIYLRRLENQLDEIVIKSTNISLTQNRLVHSLSRINNSDLALNSNHDLSQNLNSVAGVFMQSGTLNTNRITIRGIGARNLFGTANIRAYFGDIPLTDGNGESAIEDMELQAISSIEIFKGPSASTFGVGLGGAIVLQPDFGFSTNSNLEASYILGSYGFQKSTLKSAISFKKANLNVVFSNTHSDGYRNNNQYDRNTITANSKVYLGLQDELTLITSFISLKGGIPSSLSQENLRENPRQAAFTWGRSKAYEDMDYALIGASWKHTFSKMFSLLSSLNTSFRNNYEPRPFNILDENSGTIGFRSRIIGNANSGTTAFSYSLGGEIFYDFYGNSTFRNLYEDFDDGRGSVRGEQLSEFKERRNYFNLFAETDVDFNSKLKLNIGLHLNKTQFNVTNEFDNTEIANDGTFEYKTILSPKIGLNYIISKKLIAYGNASHGFSTPTTAETLLPDGIFNPDLKPEIGWNLETGLRYYLLNKKLYGSLALYRMLVSDLLVSRRTQEDDFFAINAGKSIHDGLEFDINYNFYQNSTVTGIVSSNISLNDFKFDEFIDFDNNFSGNRITGVPLYVFNLRASLYSESGFYGKIAYQKVGEMQANDANTVSSEAYSLLNGAVGYKVSILNEFTLNLKVNANNILDEDYVSQLQINARGFGNNAPRYFYPGLPFNIFASATLNFYF